MQARRSGAAAFRRARCERRGYRQWTSRWLALVFTATQDSVTSLHQLPKERTSSCATRLLWQASSRLESFVSLLGAKTRNRGGSAAKSAGTPERHRAVVCHSW